jgi:NTP pyrophosphatase (non-canonical NTP hydrolase)
MGYSTHGLTFDLLREANVKRSEQVFHPVRSWSLPEWACAMAGETGEACNLIKKIHRGDLTLATSREALGHELADVVIYADLLAARAGIHLGDAVRDKFNIVSDKRGSDVRL